MPTPNPGIELDGCWVRVFDAGLAFAFGVIAGGVVGEFAAPRTKLDTEDALSLGALLGVISSGLAAPYFFMLVLILRRWLHRDPPGRVAAFLAAGATFVVPVLAETILAWTIWLALAPPAIAVCLARRSGDSAARST